MFFPAVAHVAVISDLAATGVIGYGNVVFGFPVEAGDGLIAAHVRGSSVILPVMGVYAFRRFMFCEIEGAELGFVVEHVKILILSVVVDQFR